jgi:hypothetical protein
MMQVALADEGRISDTRSLAISLTMEPPAGIDLPSHSDASAMGAELERSAD